MYMLYLSLITLTSMLISRRRMPGRDWQTEFHARLFKRFFYAAERKGPEWSRKTIDDFAAASKSSSLSRVTCEPLDLAGVAALKITPLNAASDPKRIIVYMHGGGYLTGSAKSYLAFVARLVDQSSLLAYSLDYRLSPEHPFPQPQEDCYAAINAIAALHPEYELVLMGDSAGGALSISTALHAGEDLRARIAGLALISPWVDPLATTGTMQSNIANDMFVPAFLANSYAAHMAGADPLDTRANFSQADLSGLPPMLIQVAGGELFLDQVQDFAQRATAQGVPVVTQVFDTQFHVFQTLAHHFAEAKRARAGLVEFASAVKR